MNARVLALLAILFALLLAGCSFKAEGENDDDDSEGGVSVGDGDDDDDNDAPGPGLLMVLATFGLAGLARRKNG
jgi:MYXO-CTERM domain-containing protein